MVTFLGACDAQTAKTKAPERPTATAASAGTGAAGVATMPTNAIDLGLGRTRPGEIVERIQLAGDHVYWSVLADDMSVTVRRVARTGGATETLGVSPVVGSGVKRDLNFAVLGGRVFVTGASGTGQPRASLFELVKGELREHARGPVGTSGSSGLVAFRDKLFWTAHRASVAGPLMETSLTGATRTYLCETLEKPEPDEPAEPGGTDCEHWVLEGTPVLARDASRLWAIRARPERVEVAPCPESMVHTRAVDAYVQCTPFGDSDATVTTLVRVSEPGAIVVPRLGEGVQLARGAYYHTMQRTLLRRDRLAGRDAPFAPNVELFETDARGVVWLSKDRLYYAPHLP